MKNSTKVLLASLLSAGMATAMAGGVTVGSKEYSDSQYYTGSKIQSVNSSKSAINSSGLYISAGAGLTEINRNIKTTVNVGGHHSVNFKYQQSSPYLSAGLGFGWQIKQNYYSAIEASYNYIASKSTALRQDSGFDNFYLYPTSDQQQFVADALFGRTVMDKFLAFAKLGYAVNWTQNRFGASSGGRPAQSSSGLYGKINHAYQGILLGAGVRLPVSSRFELSAEYNYINYFSSTFTKRIYQYTSGNGNNPYTFKPKGHANNVLVSVIYKV